MIRYGTSPGRMAYGVVVRVDRRDALVLGALTGVHISETSHCSYSSYGNCKPGKRLPYSYCTILRYHIIVDDRSPADPPSIPFGGTLNTVQWSMEFLSDKKLQKMVVTYYEAWNNK